MKATYATTVFVHQFDGKNKLRMEVENWPHASAWADAFGEKLGACLDQHAKYGCGIKRTQKARDGGLSEVKLNALEFELLNERGAEKPVEQKKGADMSLDDLEVLMAKKRAEAAAKAEAAKKA